MRRLEDRYLRRARLGRPPRLGMRRWVLATCAALEQRGYPACAAHMRACGSCLTADCPCCGLRYARVEVQASCHVRVCPFCARVDAEERVRLVVDGALRAVDVIAAQRDKALAAVQGDLADAERAEAYHHRVADGARARAEQWRTKMLRSSDLGIVERAAAQRDRDLGIVERATERERLAGERAASLRRQVHAIRESKSWRWKLISWGPRYDPADPVSYEPKALRDRVGEVFAAFSRCWDAGACAGGLAFSALHIENSIPGHVHGHALYFGPFIAQSWWQDTAGCIVDVREIKTGVDGKPNIGGVVEAVKYALKTPSPVRSGWVAGEKWTVPHPDLAASWTIATIRLQLHRYYGIADDCVREGKAAREAALERQHQVEKERQGEGQDGGDGEGQDEDWDEDQGEDREARDDARPCPNCEAPVPRPSVRANLCEVAKALGLAWGDRVAFTRAPSEWVAAQHPMRGPP